MLKETFEPIIDNNYHTGATNMGQRGFGSLTPKSIQEKLLHLYRNPSLP